MMAAGSIGRSGYPKLADIQLLHLEDSPLDAELVRVRLVKEGLRLEVHRAVGHADYLAALRTRRFDLILADYSLPGFDGLAALDLARSMAPDTPFLFVSGVLGEEVAIGTLEQGATDYVLKDRLDRLAHAIRRALTEARERVDRRKAEAALRERERMHRMTLDSIRGHAILTMDVDGLIIGANVGAEGVLGFREHELLGRHVGVIFTEEDVRAGVPARELATAARRGIAEDERWHLREDGSRFWGSGLATPLLDEAGDLRGFIKVVRDMTDRKRAEEALREADHRKDEFLAMLGHELRNPLSALHNAARLARQPGTTPERLAWTGEVIADQVRHLTRLVDDLLDVSRITQGKIRLRAEPLDLADVLARAVEAARPSIEEKGHALALAVGPGPLPAEADPTRLEQVFVNLLANAAKYTDPGGKITLAAAREGDDLVVRVGDDGVGIGPEMLPRVFDLFAQVERSLDRSQGGLGIGLTIARRLVELHGGSIEAASDGPGRGSEFAVRLPALADRPAPRADAPAQAQPPSAPAGASVLVVDDNLPSADALAGLLRLSGYRAQAVHDGREAIAEAQRLRPDVVLLDIGLPGLDGYQVAEQLRRVPGMESATIIAITGYGEDHARRRSREVGFDHHLVKPVDYDNLLALLARERSARDDAAGSRQDT